MALNSVIDPGYPQELHAAYESGQAVNMYDFLTLESDGTLKRVSRQSDQGTEAQNQAAAAQKFVGLAADTRKSNSPDEASLRVMLNCVKDVAVESATTFVVGDYVSFVGATTLSDTQVKKTTTLDNAIGRVVENKTNATKIRVWFVSRAFAGLTGAMSQAAAVTALTDSSGGSADNTIVDCNDAVTGVDGTGSNAASRTDVNTRLVAIGNNISDLAAKINAVIAAMQDSGQMAS